MILKKWLGYLTGKFTQTPNEIINDPEVGLKELGLFVWLASLMPGWRFRLSDISAKKQNGEKSVRSALRRLTKSGWATVTQRKNEQGHYDYEVELHSAKQKKSGRNGQAETAAYNNTMNKIVNNTDSNNNKSNNINDFDVKFTKRLITDVILLAGRKRPDPLSFELWANEVRAMREDDGYEPEFLDRTLDAVIASDFWPKFIRDTEYFRLKLKEGKLYPDMNSKKWGKKTVSTTPKNACLPQDFIEWIRSYEPEFLEKYGAEKTEELALWEEAIRTGSKDDSISRVVEEAKRRGLNK
jgi:hypothetical protein